MIKVYDETDYEYYEDQGEKCIKELKGYEELMNLLDSSEIDCTLQNVIKKGLDREKDNIAESISRDDYYLFIQGFNYRLREYGDSTYIVIERDYKSNKLPIEYIDAGPCKDWEDLIRSLSPKLAYLQIMANDEDESYDLVFQFWWNNVNKGEVKLVMLNEDEYAEWQEEGTLPENKVYFTVDWV